VKPLYRSGSNSWHGHQEFAIELVSTIRPKNIVELGVHWGDSYFSFCQGIHYYDIPCFAYGIDTWEGDAHSGKYGEEVYQSAIIQNKKYNEFSTLIRSTFTEARPKFYPKSVDVLHIDGFHTYESVSHDFNEWKDTLSSKGIVLLHGTNVEHFGVKKFFNEQSEKYPHFEFKHSNGLGILVLGKMVGMYTLRSLVEKYGAGDGRKQ
jgi:hypothetical protein